MAAGLDHSTFTLEGVQAMFDQYMDEDNSDVIGGKLPKLLIFLSG